MVLNVVNENELLDESNLDITKPGIMKPSGDEESGEKKQDDNSILPTATASVDAVVTTSHTKSSTDPVQYVSSCVEKFHDHSHLHRQREIPNILKSDLGLGGAVLGYGGFGLVQTVQWKGEKYAMKQLKPTIVSDPAKFHIAAADLVQEIEFLEALDHPHIIRIHAKHVDMEQLQNNFFLVDILSQSLTSRMKEWRERDVKLAKRTTPTQRLVLLQERLQVCKDVAEALQYLHQENVLYRDLKVDNLGFDAEGNVKLFDFGLAKELKDEYKAKGMDGKYRLSGHTGSLAYMAPEVAKGWKYDRKVDIYGFGILLWEMVSLEVAFPDYNDEDDMHRVWAGDERPPLQNWWPVKLQLLIKRCWAYFSNSRPEWSFILETLQELIGTSNESVTSGNDDESEDTLRNVKSFRFATRRNKDAASRIHATAPRPQMVIERKKKFLGLF